MPLRKPRARPLPMPFKEPEWTGDENQRLRMIRLRREMANGEGYSWSDPPPGLWQRLQRWPRYRLVFAIMAAGMGMGLVGMFVVASNTGFKPPPQIIYFENWGAGRTAEDARADQKEAMDRLRAEVEANRAAVAAAEARARALEAERAAAARASS